MQESSEDEEAPLIPQKIANIASKGSQRLSRGTSLEATSTAERPSSQSVAGNDGSAAATAQKAEEAAIEERSEDEEPEPPVFHSPSQWDLRLSKFSMSEAPKATGENVAPCGPAEAVGLTIHVMFELGGDKDSVPTFYRGRITSQRRGPRIGCKHRVKFEGAEGGRLCRAANLCPYPRPYSEPASNCCTA